MNIMKVKKVNAFTKTVHGGNPAGVVLQSSHMTENQMKLISKILHVSETAYVYPSNVADYKVRFFSPTVEVDLCGHATIAAFFTMAKEKNLPVRKEKTTVDQETNAGIFPVDVHFTKDDVDKVMMTQKTPLLKGIHIDRKQIAKSLNIEEADINKNLPNQIVSTGLFTLPICIKSFDTLKNIIPDSELIKQICTTIRVGSFHVFTFETLEDTSVYHARNFPPLYGINEDPVTGTANGAVCSYLIKNKIITQNNLICEQGDVIGRPGRVFVEINDSTVKVGGKACFVEEKEIKFE